MPSSSGWNSGRFRFPDSTGDDAGVEIRAADLMMILDGVDLESVKRRKRYVRPQPATSAPPAPSTGAAE
jgi:hypothetical protein